MFKKRDGGGVMVGDAACGLRVWRGVSARVCPPEMVALPLSCSDIG